MKKALAFPLVVFCVLLPAITALACGDKLLRLNRLYRQHVPLNTTVLIYMRPDSQLAKLSASSLEHAFRDEGYKLLLVNNERDLTLALEAGAAEVVIAELADIPSIQRLAKNASFRMIPVVPKGNMDNESEARQYPTLIKSPAKPGKFLDAVDRAFESKPASGPKIKPVSTSF